MRRRHQRRGKPIPIPLGLPAPICGAFATVIREAREELGLSQYEVAKRATIQPRTIRLIEQARSVPKLDTAERIGTVLDIPLERLIALARKRC